MKKLIEEAHHLVDNDVSTHDDGTHYVERTDALRLAKRLLEALEAASGENGEPLACALGPGHDGTHSWATLPSFGSHPLTVENAEIGQIVEAFGYVGPGAWTSILTLVREHPGEAHYQATNLCHFARRIAEIAAVRPGDKGDDVAGTRYGGTRYGGTRYGGTRYGGTRYGTTAELSDEGSEG